MQQKYFYDSHSMLKIFVVQFYLDSVLFTIQTSIASVAGPPSPATIKKLLRIRMMSEMVRTPAAGNIVTIPTQVADISADWVKMVVNQWKVGCC